MQLSAWFPLYRNHNNRTLHHHRHDRLSADFLQATLSLKKPTAGLPQPKRPAAS